MVLRMMTKRKNKNYCSMFCAGLSALLLSAFPLSFVSCIDEDLSRCGVNYSVDYRLELSASLRQTLDQQLTTPAERQLAAALRSDMTDIMSERAAVMDLSFFTLEDGNLAQHQTVEPDANNLSMTIYMNRGDYHNIALAATHSVSEVTISGASTYTGISLRQAQADTLDSHSAAIYMGYGRMLMDNVSGHFYVPLYMVNSVPVLVVNPNNSPAKALVAYTRRTSSGLHCSDSTFVYDNEAVIRTHRTEGGGLLAFHSVCFPSANTAKSRATDDPTVAEGSIWEMDLITQMPDGKYVKNTLYMKNPLKAGEMQVIKVKLNDEGGVVTENPEVGVSVELDWKPGGDFDIEI